MNGLTAMTRTLARAGARIRLAEIARETAALEGILDGAGGEGPTRRAPAKQAIRRNGRKRGAMSRKERKAVSARMRKYWAARRAKKAKKVKA